MTKIWVSKAMEYKKFVQKLTESTKNVVHKEMIGKKKKTTAEIRTANNKFHLFVDGQMFDTFKSEKDAKNGLKDLAKLMDKE